MIILCVNLRDPTSLGLRRTGLRETKSALTKIWGKQCLNCDPCNLLDRHDNSLRKSARSDFARATSDRSAGNKSALKKIRWKQCLNCDPCNLLDRHDNSLRKSARSDFARATSDRSAGNKIRINEDLGETMPEL